VNGTRITGPTVGALILFIVAVLLVVAGTGYAVLEGQRQAQAVAAGARALCAEQAVIGTVAVPASAGKVSVQLVIDFRAAYAGLGCTPALPPPSAELRRLAAKFGVPVRN
jgi:hypothetical protein